MSKVTMKSKIGKGAYHGSFKKKRHPKSKKNFQPYTNVPRPYDPYVYPYLP